MDPVPRSFQLAATEPGPVRPTFSPTAPVPLTDRPAEGRTGRCGHPVVDAAIEMIANAADLPPGDQIAQYEAAHRALQETLATIDQA